MIFDMYGRQGIGYNTIAYQLNQMHIPSRTGTWGQTSITNILNNEVYLGKIRWRHEPTKRIVKDGMLVKNELSLMIMSYTKVYMNQSLLRSSGTV